MADLRNSIITTLCTDVYYILRRNDDTAVIASLRGQTVGRPLRSECFAYWQNNIVFKHYSSYETHVLAKCINKKINCSDFFSCYYLLLRNNSVFVSLTIGICRNNLKLNIKLHSLLIS